MIGFLMHEISTKSNKGYILYSNFIDIFKDYKLIGIPIQEIDNIKSIIDICDGIILQGGDDFSDIDLSIVKYLYDIDKPVLGICLGMQMMSVCFNGSLSNINNHRNTFHKVLINTNSRLYEIIKDNYIYVNSYHNEFVCNTDLFISGISNVIESVEDSTKRFFIGLQWHPEKDVNEISYKIFNEFKKSISQNS